MKIILILISLFSFNVFSQTNEIILNPYSQWNDKIIVGNKLTTIKDRIFKVNDSLFIWNKDYKLYTSNTGINWKLRCCIPVNCSWYELIDSTTYITTSNNTILKSIDGVKWITVYSNTNNINFISMQFSTPLDGLVYYTEMINMKIVFKLMYTTNGGITWNQCINNPSYILRLYYKDDIAYIYTDNNEIYRSFDKGITWVYYKKVLIDELKLKDVGYRLQSDPFTAQPFVFYRITF
jgi:hypothetical protein